MEKDILKNESLSEKFVKKGFWLYFFSFIIAPIGYIIRIIVSWELTVSEIWILYGTISLIGLLTAFNDLWMTESMKKFIPKYIIQWNYDKVKTIIMYSFLTQIITWVIIAWFFFFWAEYISNNYFKTLEAIWVLKVFSIYFIWINVFQILLTFFIAIQNTFYSKIMEFVRILFILIMVLVFFIIEVKDIILFSYSWIIGLYVSIILSIFLFYSKYYDKYLKKSKIIWSKKIFKKVFSYAVLIFLSAQSSSILWQIDMQMVIYLLGTKSAWYYTNYLSIVSIPFMLIWPILWLLFPVFSELYEKRDFEKIKTIKKICTKLFIGFISIFSILFFTTWTIISYILFWEKYIVSWNILQYSILLLIFNFLFQINFSILSWVWKVKAKLVIIVIAVFFNFISNLILINLIWVFWAALSTWIGRLLIWLLSERSLWKKYRIKFDFSFIFKNIFFIWLLWLFTYNYINPLFEWIWRINSFMFMLLIWITWFIFFWLLNLWILKSYILEIRKVIKI